MNQTDLTRKRYDRLSRIYSYLEKGMGYGLNKWRKRLFSRIRGRNILEVGVGTGANLPYYPKDLDVTGIDFSPGMLTYAKNTVDNLDLSVQLLEMDVQHLKFPNDSFDTVIATCVFCSVPDPVKGLQEIYRVFKSGGKLLMLEHVLSCRLGLRQVMNIVNPVVLRVMGSNINRETRDYLEQSGFIVREKDLWLDILKIFVATKSKNKSLV